MKAEQRNASTQRRVATGARPRRLAGLEPHGFARRRIGQPIPRPQLRPARLLPRLRRTHTAAAARRLLLHLHHDPRLPPPGDATSSTNPSPTGHAPEPRNSTPSPTPTASSDKPTTSSHTTRTPPSPQPAEAGINYRPTDGDRVRPSISATRPSAVDTRLVAPATRVASTWTLGRRKTTPRSLGRPKIML